MWLQSPTPIANGIDRTSGFNSSAAAVYGYYTSLFWYVFLTEKKPVECDWFPNIGLARVLDAVYDHLERTADLRNQFRRAPLKPQDREVSTQSLPTTSKILTCRMSTATGEDSLSARSLAPAPVATLVTFWKRLSGAVQNTNVKGQAAAINARYAPSVAFPAPGRRRPRLMLPSNTLESKGLTRTGPGRSEKERRGRSAFSTLLESWSRLWSREIMRGERVPPALSCISEKPKTLLPSDAQPRAAE